MPNVAVHDLAETQEVSITPMELVALQAVPWHRYANAGVLGDVRHRTIVVGSIENRRAIVTLLLRAAGELPRHLPVEIGMPGSCCIDPMTPASRIRDVAMRVAAA